MAQKKSTSLWVWASLLLMLGAFVAFVLFLDQKIVDNSSSASKQTTKSGTENKPTIDFYSVLPQREVEISISEEQREAIDNPSINKDVVGQAILQVGVFPECQGGRQPESAVGIARSSGEREVRAG